MTYPLTDAITDALRTAEAGGYHGEEVAWRLAGDLLLDWAPDDEDPDAWGLAREALAMALTGG